MKNTSYFVYERIDRDFRFCNLLKEMTIQFHDLQQIKSGTVSSFFYSFSKKNRILFVFHHYK